jgi:2-keto-3-deoxy-6-phosphogluconate aldolase
VNQVNSPKFIVAGASAIGVGAELFPPEGLTHRQENRIHELARRFLNMVREGRRSLPAASI